MNKAILVKFYSILQIDSLIVQTNQRPAHYELDQSNTSKLSQTDTRQIHNTDKTDTDNDQTNQHSEITDEYNIILLCESYSYGTDGTYMQNIFYIKMVFFYGLCSTHWQVLKFHIVRLSLS